MENISNPFCYDFVEQRAIETMSKRAQAQYNEPRELAEDKQPLKSFFDETFAASPNPAHVIGTSPIEPQPHVQPTA